jgi:two-component system CheB/CheR fusion protein
MKDDGRGISREMLSEIFDLFVQAEQGLERSTGGLGIGLTLVRKIVELHGGTVEALSDGLGKGSKFVVLLPRQDHAVLNSTRRTGSPSPARVVIVEDQDDTREMLRVLLESGGHVVLEESNGKAAVDTIEREHPDVALIDIGLPVMNGYEVARRLRSNPVLDDVMLVALTGYGTDHDVAEARAAGFDDHLIKPTDIERIDEVMARRRQTRRAS